MAMQTRRYFTTCRERMEAWSDFHSDTAKLLLDCHTNADGVWLELGYAIRPAHSLKRAMIKLPLSYTDDL
jgi:hypothetical protein